MLGDPHTHTHTHREEIGIGLFREHQAEVQDIGMIISIIVFGVALGRL